jgi:formate--tetrahydrofolate ligase
LRASGCPRPSGAEHPDLEPDLELDPDSDLNPNPDPKHPQPKEAMPDTILSKLADELGIPATARDLRGDMAMKVDSEVLGQQPKGRIVLVTAMTPTPAGEGKTTTTIGLVDALRAAKMHAVGALRQPSLGPIFGVKGGAVGGGRAMVTPAEGINLHFTGDMHAVTSAHALLSAMLDNHLFHGLEPRFPVEGISWGRAVDMNDRALRDVMVGQGDRRRGDRFDITAASEVMAILCMSRDIADLRARLDRVVVATTSEGAPVTAADLKAGGAMAALLLAAARPNLVRTLEGSPVFIHGGPFGNVAQGTSSLIQTQMCRKLADVVVTEGGFAFDLGGFKFIDLQCRAGGFRPAAIVLVATVRALRHQGGAEDYTRPNIPAVERGVENVAAHLESMKRLGLPPPVVAINRFPDDAPDELAILSRIAEGFGATAVAASHFAEGPTGAVDLAAAVRAALAAGPADSPGFRPPYDAADSIPKKVEDLARTVLGARDVSFSEGAKADLARIEKAGLDRLPLCLAKTHLSISDDAKVRGRPAPFTLKVTGLRPSAGAGFVVVLCGPILTMPGLAARPSAYGIDIERGPGGAWQVRGLR